MPRIPLIPALFAGAALVTGGVLLGRRLSKRAREKAWKKAPGRSPERPVYIERFDELDETLRQTRCWCGGHLVHLSEGAVQGPSGTVRVAHAECVRCEADHHLYFDVTGIRH